MSGLVSTDGSPFVIPRVPHRRTHAVHFSVDCRATPSPEFYLNPFFDRRVSWPYDQTAALPAESHVQEVRFPSAAVWKVSRETAKRNWVQKGQADSVMTWMESEIFLRKAHRKDVNEGGSS